MVNLNYLTDSEQFPQNEFTAFAIKKLFTNQICLLNNSSAAASAATAAVAVMAECKHCSNKMCIEF